MSSPILRSVRRPMAPPPGRPVGAYRVCDRPEQADSSSELGRAVENERAAQHDAIDLGVRVGAVLDLHRRAERLLEEARQTLVRAVDNPGLLDSFDWSALAEARLQIELLGTAVDLANRRVQHARESAHAAAETRVSVWAQYSEKRRRWENPDVYLNDRERADAESELIRLAGPAA